LSHVTATVHLEGREVTITLPVKVTRYANTPQPDSNNAETQLTEAAHLALAAINSKGSK
jgi:hypothetical protein